MQVERRQLVTIDMRVYAPPYRHSLVLKGPGVSLEGDGRWDKKHIRTILEPGTYQITVRTPEGWYSDTTAFLLTARGRSPDSSPLTIGQPKTGELLPSLLAEHPFSVRQAGEYTIMMTSLEVDSYLRLFRNGEKIAEADNRKGGQNIRITRHLEPGEYMITAFSVGGKGSRYQIEVRRQ